MNGVTCPVFGFTITIRELLLNPVVRRDWFESVAKSRPPSKPLSNAMSIAGPCAWRPPPPAVGLARVRSSCPLLLNTRMSGVNGLVGENSPPTTELVSSLHRLGRPCPDSSTYTSKRSSLPRNAIPVGKFRPVAKTDTSKPTGTTTSWPLSGLNDTVLFVQIGFATVVAAAKGGSVRNSASANTKLIARGLLDRIGHPSSPLDPEIGLRLGTTPAALPMGRHRDAKSWWQIPLARDETRSLSRWLYTPRGLACQWRVRLAPL